MCVGNWLDRGDEPCHTDQVIYQVGGYLGRVVHDSKSEYFEKLV